jgi:hypothetical protein
MVVWIGITQAMATINMGDGGMQTVGWSVRLKKFFAWFGTQ